MKSGEEEKGRVGKVGVSQQNVEEAVEAEEGRGREEIRREMKHEEEEEEDKGSVGKGERIKSGEEEEGGEGVGGKWGERSDVSEAPQGQMTRPTPSRTGYLRVPAASLSFLPICRIMSAYLPGFRFTASTAILRSFFVLRFTHLFSVYNVSII